jgi:putative endonuclease
LAEQPIWYIYLLRCANGDLYTGISTDVARRLQQHAANRGARRLRGKGPLQLVFSHPAGDRSQALRLEHRVKRLSRLQKEELVRGERDLPRIEAGSQQG